jgi:Tol biopolymer transport system component
VARSYRATTIFPLGAPLDDQAGMTMYRALLSTLPLPALLSLSACTGTGAGSTDVRGGPTTSDYTLIFQRNDDGSDDFGYGSLDGHVHTVRTIGFSYQDATALSPDGKRFAYWAAHGDPHPVLWVGALAGAQSDDVAIGREAFMPTFSPDGNQLAFVGAVFQPGQTIGRISVYVVDATGGAATPIDLLAQKDPAGVITHPAQCNGPSWSPDGKRLAFATDTGVTIYDLAAHTLHALTSNQSAWTCEARWSPDGSTIAYIAGGADGQAQLMKVPCDGGTPVAIAAVDGAAGDASFRWSPDGADLAYVDHGAHGYAIHTVAARGGAPATLDSIGGDGYLGVPEWSPDGTTLLYSVFDGTAGDSSHLATIDVGAGHRTMRPLSMQLDRSYYAWLPAPVAPACCGQ